MQKGTLSLGHNAALGIGTLTIDAGTSIYVDHSIVNANNNPQIWNGNFAYMWGVGGTLDLGTGAVTMNNNVQVEVNDNLTVGGTITGTGTSLTKTGSRTLTLNGAVNLGTGSITVNAGTLILGSANTFSGGVNVNAGTLIAGHSQALGTGLVTLAENTHLQVATGVATVKPVVLSGLSFGAGTANNFDVTNNYVVITGAAGSLTTFAPHMITSTTLIGGASGYNVGVALVTGQEFNDLRGAGTFVVGSTTINNGDLLVRFAMAGDSNLDNKITLDDYIAIDAGFRLPGVKDWAHGDYNKSGTVDAADYALIDHNAAKADPVFGAEMEALHASWFGGAYGAAMAALDTPVPEPTSLALLGLGAAALLRRRRR